ncbi:GNAT family protein [Streptomyces lunalinharesii]|uniref:GNAT family protein n=1 Tax=Streptomyces lunalinharesii TaxID=333384 RepID=A0ABP6F8J5_9ACTN
MTRSHNVILCDREVTLRSLSSRDQQSWCELNDRDRDWFRPWEGTDPNYPSQRINPDPATYRKMFRYFMAEARAGRMLPFAIEHQGSFVGQLLVSGIVRGSMRCAQLGVWLSKQHAGQGIAVTSVALATDHCLGPLGLYRIECFTRTENTPARRIMEKLGFCEHGVIPGYMHVDGKWRDHVMYGITSDEIPAGGLVEYWRNLQEVEPTTSDSTT